MDQIVFSAKSNLSGILTADRYFRSIEGCFEGGFCPTKLFEQSTPEQWAQELESAALRLVYTDDEMSVKDLATGGMALSAGSIMDFDAVITSTRKDHDGDVLESSGAIVDPKCALLWQHITLQPIGKLVSVISANSKNVQGRFCIANTELGRDAAALIEMGALRISHGFEPAADGYEPLEKEGRWHITKFHVMEVSVVSIPSNTDAVITAFSRGKLHSALVKGWAGRLYDSRKQVWQGFCLPSPKATPCSCKSESGLREPISEDEKRAVENGHGSVIGSCGHVVQSCRCYSAELIREQRSTLCEACAAKNSEPTGEKAGRALSAANKKLINEAAANMDAVCDMDDVSRPAKALCREANGHLAKVLNSSDVQRPQGEPTDSTVQGPQTQNVNDMVFGRGFELPDITEENIEYAKALHQRLGKAIENSEFQGVLALLEAAG